MEEPPETARGDIVKLFGVFWIDESVPQKFNTKG